MIDRFETGATSLRHIKWLTILAPLVFLGTIEIMREYVAPDLLGRWPGNLVVMAIVLVGSLLFAESVFRVIGRLQGQLVQQNRELLALHDAGLAISSDLDLESVLQRVVTLARELVGARYGALSFLDEEGNVGALLTSGISQDDRLAIGPEPHGHGLLGVVLEDGQSLRLDDIEQDARSTGFPPQHPVMRSLLAVPIRSKGRVLGNLYLTDKQTSGSFSEEDEATLQRFATQAALSIENARLHQRVQALAVTEERERIAREMHDSLAQVLGYVNTKAQAAQVLLKNGQQDRASRQIGELADAARTVYADVRENILGLRTSLQAGKDLRQVLSDYVASWRGQAGLDVTLNLPDGDRLPLSPSAEVQLLRIIQEALANVRKHAGATAVRIEVQQDGEDIIAVIEDNGVGFDQDRLGRAEFPRFGLSTMRERAEATGGTMSIRSRPGSGTRVEVRLPGRRILRRGGGSTNAGDHR